MIRARFSVAPVLLGAALLTVTAAAQRGNQTAALVITNGKVLNADGTFSVDMSKIKDAVASLDREFLTLEATGDYAGAKKLMTTMMVIRPETQKALDRLKSVPTDIEPVFVTADALLKPATPAKK